jgi:hypothetical protein
MSVRQNSFTHLRVILVLTDREIKVTSIYYTIIVLLYGIYWHAVSTVLFSLKL